MILFVQYPKCSTCQRAKKWLISKEISFEDRHIAEHNPTLAELTAWHKASGLPLKKFFNTSGQLYRELGLKDQLQTMSSEEQLNLLSTNGMLVKRPLVITEHAVLVGFKEVEWENALGAMD